jgi:threonine dehydrogenase-like Zn-dependent dehydrogenase
LTHFAYPGAPNSAQLVLDLMASGKIKTQPFVSHRINAGDARRAYEGLIEAPQEYLGVILDLKSW